MSRVVMDLGCVIGKENVHVECVVLEEHQQVAVLKALQAARDAEPLPHNQRALDSVADAISAAARFAARRDRAARTLLAQAKESEAAQ